MQTLLQDFRYGVRITPFTEQALGDARLALWTLLAADSGLLSRTGVRVFGSRSR